MNSPESDSCRLLIDPPAPGAWNMAVDEALLESAASEGSCWWRFYQWDEPTLSLGYFQAAEDRQRHAPSRDRPLVRRPSGGGAIVHDVELTYSFAVPAGHRLAMGARGLYEVVHQALVGALRECGADVSLLGPAEPRPARQQPFLCFQRRSPGDVVLGDHKIAGSAQRRRAGAVLQHGSVLLGRSSAAPELPGLAELAGHRIPASALMAAWLARLAEVWAVRFMPWKLPAAERRRAAILAEVKYGSDRWTLHRGRLAQRLSEKFPINVPSPSGRGLG